MGCAACPFTMKQLPSSAPRDGAGAPRAISTPKTSKGSAAWRERVAFPEWRELLALEPLESHVRYRHAQAIMRYLRHCKVAVHAASIADAKEYLEASEAAGELGENDRAALRWFE